MRSNNSDDYNGSCLARVRSAREGASVAARKVADFILNCPAEASRLPIGELATRCNTSLATVTRFCSSLGYNGYRQFQHDLIVALADTNETVRLADFAEGASPSQIIQHVFELNRRSLSDTEKILDRAALVSIARKVLKADKTYFLGTGESATVAESAAQRLQGLGLVSLAVTDPYSLIFVTNAVRRGDVVFGISHSGQNELIVEALNAATENGAETVALTNYPSSPLVAVCRRHLLTALQEHQPTATVSSSRIAQSCVIDSLYFVIASWRQPQAVELARRAEQRVEQVLRTKSAQLRRRKQK